MKIEFTKHAKGKFTLLKHANFPSRKSQVINCLLNPIKIEERPNDTFIATTTISTMHILRVVYKIEDDTMLVITFYPGRRNAYGF